MKIAFSIKAVNNSGGTERVLAVVAGELVRRGHSVDVISFVGGGKSPFFNFDPSIRIHYLCEGPSPKKKFGITRARIAAMREIYAQISPDVIIIVDAGRSFVNVPAAEGYRMITWEHFNTHINWHLFHPASRRMAAKASDWIVTLTERDAESYREKFHAPRVQCIYNPVTIDSSVPSPLTEKVVLSAGRLCSQKRPDILLQAWAKTDGRSNGWKLKIIGSGSRKWEDMLRKMIVDLGISDSVVMADRNPAVEEEMRKASVYAMASDFEGLPLVLIEAQAMGLPEVSTDCYTGPAEIVEEGRTGFLVPCRDTDALAAALDKLMADEKMRAEFSARSLERAREVFSTESIMKEWDSLLEKVVSAR